MNKLQEKLSILLKNKKVKGLVIGTSFLVLGALNLPTINGIIEKYGKQDKIGTRPKYERDIQQLFEQLGYNNRAHTLRMNDANDIDLGHLKGSKDTMDNLLHQFHSLQETNEKTIISIPGCWTGFNIVRNNIQASYNCQILREVQDKFNLSEKETIFVLSALMHLALSEYTEEQQAKERYTRRTTASGNNSVDFRGNIAGVVATLDNDNESYDINILDVEKILYEMQKNYHTIDAKSTFEALGQDFDLQVQIIDKK